MEENSKSTPADKPLFNKDLSGNPRKEIWITELQLVC